jgi:hypothetical protein
MALEEETEQLLEFHKSLSDNQAVQFMRVLGSATIHGEEFIKEGIKTLLAHELKLPPKETD